MSEEEIVGSGWDNATTHLSGRYFKLESGESVELVFVDGPTFIQKVWREGEEPKSQARFEVWLPEAGATKVWDMSVKTFGAVKRQHERRKKDFDRSLFAVTKSGTGFQTVWAVDYVRPLTDEELARSKGGDAPDPF